MKARAPASLRGRLALAGGAGLAVFLVLAGIALERAFQRSLDAGVRQSLQTRAHLLLGAVELGDNGRLQMPGDLSDPSLTTPDSGVYAAIRDGRGRLLWRSDSSLGRDIGYPRSERPGEPVHARIDGPGGSRLHALAHPVVWELGDGATRRLDFLVAARASALGMRVGEFRRTLWTGFAAVFAAAVLGLVGLLRWGLRPLRRAAHEVAAIEAGERSALGPGYPRELRPLTENLNALLTGSAARLQRYRDALDELAHSLKTPLAVLRSGEADAVTVREQAERMTSAIDWHLRRAAAAGRSGLVQRVDVDAAIGRVTAALARVRADKAVALERDVPVGTGFRGDPEDLVEILGNLLDNAWKWCAGNVRVAAVNTGDGGLELVVEDDGPGIPPARRRAVLERGVRADERQPGEGLGLYLVRSMVEDAYGGRVALATSGLGGLRIAVTLPGAGAAAA